MSIYDSTGGAPAVQAAVDNFYLRVLADSTLAPFFADADIQRLKRHQRSFIAAAIGGPEGYAGPDVGSGSSPRRASSRRAERRVDARSDSLGQCDTPSGHERHDVGEVLGCGSPAGGNVEEALVRHA